MTFERKDSMSLFVIDQEKCRRDGVCVAECPLSIIEMKGSTSTPAPIANAEGNEAVVTGND